MSSTYFFVLQLAVLSYALIGGVFLAFSDFIMRSLAHTGGLGGVEAMQIINREVFRWVFMTLFIGMAAVSLGIAVHSALFLSDAQGMLILSASLVYLVGCFAVTACFNVPLNEALARMDLTAEATREYWTTTYLPRWTTWNTVRTISCALSSGLMLFGLVWVAQSQSI